MNQIDKIDQMDQELIKQRHYIYINPNNLNEKVSDIIKNIHNDNYINQNVNIKYHYYYEIYQLLQEYDTELSELFLKINTNYAALLADIGRYIILYNYGGVYHDLKCMSNNKINKYITKNYNNGKTFIAQQHAIETHRIRNTNIIVLERYHVFINEILQRLKNNLKEAKIEKHYGSKAMIKIGSGTYISGYKEYKTNNIFSNITHEFYDEFINRSSIIYNTRFKKWQNIEEPIFIK